MISQFWRGMCCVSLVVLVACSHGPDEAALRARLDAMIEAIESREPRTFMAGVTEDFIGDLGLDHNRLQSYLRAQLLRNTRVGVTVVSTDVILHGERATVVQRLVLTGGGGGLIPDRLRQLRIESGWRFGESGWQVYSARWQADEG